MMQHAVLSFVLFPLLILHPFFSFLSFNFISFHQRRHRLRRLLSNVPFGDACLCAAFYCIKIASLRNLNWFLSRTRLEQSKRCFSTSFLFSCCVFFCFSYFLPFLTSRQSIRWTKFLFACFSPEFPPALTSCILAMEWFMSSNNARMFKGKWCLYTRALRCAVLCWVGCLEVKIKNKITSDCEWKEKKKSSHNFDNDSRGDKQQIYLLSLALCLEMRDGKIKASFFLIYFKNPP